MPKQTSVEWLVNELKKSKHYHQMINEVHRNSTIVIDVIEQAKAMEKEQIVNTYRDGRTDQQSERSSLWYNRNAEYYYNETYGGQDA